MSRLSELLEAFNRGQLNNDSTVSLIARLIQEDMLSTQPASTRQLAQDLITDGYITDEGERL